MKCRPFILLISLFSIMASCKMGYIVVDVEEAPRLKFDQEISSLVLNNRITDTSALKISATKNVVISGTSDEAIPSLAALKVISSVAAAIYDKDVYFLHGARIRFPNLKDVGKFPEPILPASVLRICENCGADAIFSLEGFRYEITSQHESVIRRAVDAPELVRDNTIFLFRPTEEYHNIILKTFVELGWRIYSGIDGSIMYEGWLSDSVRYEVQGKSKEDAEKALPSSLNVVEKAAFIAGENILSEISPSYQTVERHYFKKGNPGFRKAYQLVKFRRWDDAAAIWRPYISDTDHKIKAMALYNLALVAEKNGDLLTAKDLIDQAVSLYPIEDIILYQGIIMQRIH